MFGENLGEFRNATCVAEELNCNSANIYACLREVGYYYNKPYFYLYENVEFNIQNYNTLLIVVCDLNYNFISLYYSSQDAYTAFNSSKNTLNFYINKNKKFKKKYYLFSLKEYTKWKNIKI